MTLLGGSRTDQRFCVSTHTDRDSLRSHRTQNDRRQDHSIRRPDIARAITICWISEVPSKIVWFTLSEKDAT